MEKKRKKEKNETDDLFIIPEEQKDPSYNTICIESDLIGLRVLVHSRSSSVKKLQNLAHKSMIFLMTSLPCRIPLGVG